YRFHFFFQAEDGIRDATVTGVQTCALPIYREALFPGHPAITQNLFFQTRLRRHTATLPRRSPPVNDGRDFPGDQTVTTTARSGEIGRASCRERVYTKRVTSTIDTTGRDW